MPLSLPSRLIDTFCQLTLSSCKRRTMESGAALETLATIVTLSPRCISISPGSTLISISRGTNSTTSGSSIENGHANLLTESKSGSEAMNNPRTDVTTTEATPNEIQLAFAGATVSTSRCCSFTWYCASLQSCRINC